VPLDEDCVAKLLADGVRGLAATGVPGSGIHATDSRAAEDAPEISEPPLGPVRTYRLASCSSTNWGG